MPSQPRASAAAPAGIAFDVERYGTDGDGRLEVRGRWSGVRGRRFVRPTLVLDAEADRRPLLAVLDHKPWAAEDGEPWTAVFPWDGDGGAPPSAELVVAPDIGVALPGGAAPPRARMPAPRPGRPLRDGDGDDGPARRRTEAERDSALAGARALADERDALVARLEAAERERDAASEEAARARTERDAAARAAERAQAGRTATARERTEQDRRERADLEARVEELGRERDTLLAERDRALREQEALARRHDRAVADADRLRAERDAGVARLTAERETEVARLSAERDAALAERDTLRRERAELLPTPELRRWVLRREPLEPPAVVWATRVVALTALVAGLTLLVLFFDALFSV